MGASRIDIFRLMLEGDPDNTSVMFGLAKEYEKAGRFDEMIEVLSDYLQRADDEGNAYGMLAAAYLKTGQPRRRPQSLRARRRSRPRPRPPLDGRRLPDADRDRVRGLDI